MVTHASDTLVDRNGAAAPYPRLPRALQDPVRDEERKRRVCRAHAKFGYSQSEIARFLGLHYSTVSQIIKETGSGLES